MATPKKQPVDASETFERKGKDVKEIKPVDEITKDGTVVKKFMDIIDKSPKVSPLEVLHLVVAASVPDNVDLTEPHNALLWSLYSDYKAEFDKMFMVMGYFQLSDQTWVALAAPEQQTQNDAFKRAAGRMSQKYKRT